MVVEDDEDTRAVRRKDLEEKGFAVMTAESSDDALLTLADAPAVDLVLTDIHLGGSKKTKAGVSLARRLRQTYPEELPVVGYSGVFSERQLKEDELSLFNLTSPRNSKNWNQLDLFFGRCRDLAEDYHQWKRVRAAEHGLSRNAGDQGPPKHDPRSRGTFSPADAQDDEVGFEEALRQAGYELRLISCEDFEAVLSAVPVWIRQHDDGEWEAQIYGYPSLQTFGQSDGEVIADLVYLMQAFKSDLDLAVGSGQVPTGPAHFLHAFLQKVLRPG